MEIHGDFIEELDWAVGQVLGALDRLGVAEKTLVIFSSDNGGVVNRGNEEVAKAMDAGLAINAGLRGGKHDIWEGGFREPFLVRWPGKVPAGSVSAQVACLTDVLATLAGIIGVPLPAGPHAEDSFDVLRAFTEEKPGLPVRDHVILQAADGVYALRSGDWKMIERVDPPPFEHRNKRAAQQAERKKKTAPPHDELYDLASDPAEAKDLHDSQADRSAQMRKLLADARDRGRTR